MPYYVMKTGLPMFDACRAYGLAQIVEILAQAVDAIDDISILDIGHTYIIDGPAADELLEAKNDDIFKHLFTISNEWCGSFLTTGRATKVETLKPASRKNLEKKIKEVYDHLQNYHNWLNTKEVLSPIEIRSKSPKGLSSLPATLDAMASKSARYSKLTSYSEGDGLFSPSVDWALAMLGSTNFKRWSWAGGNYASLLPLPKRITMHGNRNVRSMVDVNYLCSVSENTAVAHYAVQLAAAIGRRLESKSVYADSYGDLLINSFTWTGSQWKVKSGAMFPIDYLMLLVQKDFSISANVLDKWNHLLRWGSVDGNEDLAISLAAFLSEPQLATLEPYAFTHLKMTITDEKRRPFAPYSIEEMKEILDHVK